MNNSNYLILSCDGGGIRGLITALLLDDLNTNHPETKNFLDHVNLFVGSSTGGIIALGLAAGVPTSTLVNLYTKQGTSIFSAYQPGLAAEVKFIFDYVGELKTRAATDTSASSPAPVAGARERGLGLDLDWHAVAEMLGSLFHVKYDSASLLSVLKTTVASKTLGELRPVMVTTFQLSDSAKMWMPLQLHNMPNSPYCDVSIYDAALATGAAPTYFPPHLVPGVGYCADGGIFANNPSPLGIALAHSQAAVPLPKMKLLSLGTGFTQQCVTDVQNALAWGPAQWLIPHATGHMPAIPLVEAIMASQMEVAGMQSKILLGADNCIYANVPLSSPYALDNARDIQTLIDQTHAYITGNTVPTWGNVPKWSDVVKWVAAQFN